MSPLETHQHTALGHHRVAGLGRAFAAGLVLQGVLAILCAGLVPFGGVEQRGFEEFATAYAWTRGLAAALFVPLVWLGIVWLGRVRANMRALAGEVVGPAHYLPDLPLGLGLEGIELDDVVAEAEDLLHGTAEAVETIADAAEQRRGPTAVRAFDRLVVWSWFFGGLTLAVFLVADLYGTFSDGEGLLVARVPQAALFLVWGVGALLTAAVVRRLTRWQTLAVRGSPRRPR